MKILLIAAIAVAVCIAFRSTSSFERGREEGRREGQEKAMRWIVNLIAESNLWRGPLVITNCDQINLSGAVFLTLETPQPVIGARLSASNALMNHCNFILGYDAWAIDMEK